MPSKQPIPLQLASAQCSLFRILQLENEEMEAFFKDHCAMANAGQTVSVQFTRCGALIAAFTSEKCKMTIKKYIPQLAIDKNFLLCICQSLHDKTKGAVEVIGK
jgi:hypothetical protein